MEAKPHQQGDETSSPFIWKSMNPSCLTNLLLTSSCTVLATCDSFSSPRERIPITGLLTSLAFTLNTQKRLLTFTNMIQSAISRLENGEEVYALALMAVLHYFMARSVSTISLPLNSVPKRNVWDAEAIKKSAKVFSGNLTLWPK